MSKEKLIIIGANDFQNQLVLKAKALGYETHVFAWAEGAVARETCDYFYDISITEKEKILDVAREIKPVGIVSIASDLAMLTVNYVAEKLNLTANTAHSTLLSTNKFEMRKAFEKHGIPCPKFRLIESIEELEVEKLEFPLIVKPTDRSGSRGVYKVSNVEELKRSMEESKSVSFSDKVLVEEFAEGKEYSVEMVSYKGEHHFLAITEKFTTGVPRFIETGHMQPAEFSEEIKSRVVETVKKALDALEIKFGASHSEFKIDSNNNIKIIEIGGRMGGDCIGSDLVEVSTGYDFKKMVIDIAAGKPLDMTPSKPIANTVLVKFIFNSEDLRVLENIKKHNPDNIYRISDIEEISSEEIKDSSARYGYFIITGSSREVCLRLAEF